MENYYFSYPQPQESVKFIPKYQNRTLFIPKLFLQKHIYRFMETPLHMIKRVKIKCYGKFKDE